MKEYEVKRINVGNQWDLYRLVESLDTVYAENEDEAEMKIYEMLKEELEYFIGFDFEEVEDEGSDEE